MQEENQTALQEENESAHEQFVDEKKRNRDLKFEMALFFILGLLVGITVKTEAVKSITIGFNDYQLMNGKQAYDVEKIKAELLQEAKQAQSAQENSQESEDLNGNENSPSVQTDNNNNQ